MRRILVVLLLVFACVAHVSANLSDSTEEDEAVLQQLTARFYNGTTIDDYVDVPMTELEQLVDRCDFSVCWKTVFLIHGYTESLIVPSVITMVNAYLEAQGDINLVGVDWSKFSTGDYFDEAIPNSKIVGNALATKLKQMVDKGLNPSNVHIVGHSLGSHVSGFIGKNLVTNYNMILNRITALDPAGPGFYPSDAAERLDAADAVIVDALLTNPKLYGYPTSIGSVTFWPNPDMDFQLGCPNVPQTDPESFCSHRRSWMYWAESLKTPNVFQAFNRDENTYANMGEAYDGVNRGNFRLKTNSESPFGMGSDGIID